MGIDGEIERRNILNIKCDNRPSDYEYALLSQHVYGPAGKTKPTKGTYCSTHSGKWSVLTTKRVFCGYFGAIYICEETKEMVVAHRGTNSLRDVFEDIRAVLFNQYTTPQKEAAFSLVAEAVNLLRTNNKYQSYHLSFTGHSLGAFLAEVSVYYAYCVLGYPDVNAVTFESPGTKAAILAMEEADGLEASLTARVNLDIVSYVCYPNLINVCNEHIGTVYSINVDLGVFGKWPGIHLLRCHSIDGIVEWFRQAVVEKNPVCKRHYMCDWPVGYKEGRVYFKYAEFDNGQYTIKRPLNSRLSKLRDVHEAEELDVIQKYMTIQKRKFELRYNGNFKIHDNLSGTNVLPLHHFHQDLQIFLRHFNTEIQGLQSKIGKNSKMLLDKTLQEKWSGLGMPENVIQYLLNLTIRRNNINVEVVKIDLDVSVDTFRRQISSWLERKPVSPEDLLHISTEENNLF